MKLAALWATSLVALAGCRTHHYADGAGKSTTTRTVVHGVPAANSTDGCIAGYTPGADYFPDKVHLQYAGIFDVAYHRNYKVVHLAVDRTLQANEKVSDTLVLVQCGTPAPTLTGGLAGATVVTIPVMSIASNDNCDIAAIALLGFEGRLAAIGGGHLYNEKVRRRWESKQLATIGYAWHGLPNSEVLLAQPPDVLFMRRATLEQGRSLARARELGIHAVPTLARHEKHYLGYAEWIKYFALFLNAEKIAERSFAGTVERCRRLTEMAGAAPWKPGVLWAGYSSGGTWAAARSPIDLRTTLLADAGAKNLVYDPNSLPSGEMPNEQLLDKAAGADFWISENTTTKGWPSETFLRHFASYRNGRIYHHEKRSISSLNAYDWYETGAMRPDLVLQDLVALFHPELAPQHELMFFDRVPAGGAELTH